MFFAQRLRKKDSRFLDFLCCNITFGHVDCCSHNSRNLSAHFSPLVCQFCVTFLTQVTSRFSLSTFHLTNLVHWLFAIIKVRIKKGPCSNPLTARFFLKHHSRFYQLLRGNAHFFLPQRVSLRIFFNFHFWLY